MFLFSYVDYQAIFFFPILHFSIFCWYWQDSNEIQKIYPTWISLYRWSVGTLKLRNNTFSQGKVHFYALFSHGKKYLCKFFLNSLLSFLRDPILLLSSCHPFCVFTSGFLPYFSLEMYCLTN